MLRTPKGAAVKILRGTFPQDVALEIKEAYTAKDMLLAGLTTESNGKPLRSGGMIYLNTKNREAVTLQKPITVLLPTNGVEENMQVFKGEETDTAVNWVEADTLTPTVNEAMLSNGKAIYVASCLTCHAVRKTLTGPALGGFASRGPWGDFRNVVRWVHNPGGFIPTTAYTRRLATQFGGQIMPSFPQLSVADIGAVMTFVQNESQKTVTDTFQLPPYLFEGGDSTSADYMQIITEEESACLDTTYTAKRDSLQLTDEYVADLLNDTSSTLNTALANPETMQGMRRGFTDWAQSDGAYRFEIKTLGWYNVDAYVAGLPGTTLCQLSVAMSEGATEALTVYAFFPQQKNLSVGQQHEDAAFHFEKVGDKIPLYLGEKGIVLAFGNRGDQFYYGTTSFTVQPSQTVTVRLRASSKEDLLNAVKAEKIEGIDLDVVRQEMIVNPCKNKPNPSASGDTTARPSAEALR